MQKIYLYTVLLFPFLIANTRMLKSIPGYSFFSLLGDVRSPMLIIPFTVVVVVYFLLYGAKKNDVMNPGLLLIIFLFTFVGSLAQGSSLGEIFQGLYMLLIPLMIFKTIIGFDRLKISVDTVIRFYVIVGVINIVPGVFTYLKFGMGPDVYFDYGGFRANKYDVVNGFLSDAHQFTIFFYFLSLIVFGYWHGRKNNALLWSVALFAVGCLGFNAKALFVFLLLLMGTLLIRLAKRHKTLLLGMTIVLILSSGFIYSLILEYDNRIELFQNASILDAPIVNPIIKSVEVLSTYPSVAFFGAGIGNYGTTIAVARANLTGAMAPLAREYNGYSIWSMTSKDDSLQKSGEFISFLSFNINTFTSLMVEIGLIVSILYFGFYVKLMMFFARAKSTDVIRNNINTVIVFYICFVFINSFLVLWGSFDDEVAIIPIIVISAFEYQSRLVSTAEMV